MIRTIPAILLSTLAIVACEPVEPPITILPPVEQLTSGLYVMEFSAPEVVGDCFGLDLRDVDGSIVHALLERNENSLFIDLEGFYLEGRQAGTQIFAEGDSFLDEDRPVEDEEEVVELEEETEMGDVAYPEEIFVSIRGAAFSPFEFEGMFEYDVRGPGVECSLDIPFHAAHKRGMGSGNGDGYPEDKPVTSPDPEMY